MTITPKQQRPVSANERCKACGIERPVDRMGVCAPCRQYQSAKLEILSVFGERGLIEDHEVWSMLKSRSIKASSRTIRRAYIDAFDQFTAKSATA